MSPAYFGRSSVPVLTTLLPCPGRPDEAAYKASILPWARLSVRVMRDDQRSMLISAVAQ